MFIINYCYTTEFDSSAIVHILYTLTQNDNRYWKNIVFNFVNFGALLLLLELFGKSHSIYSYP